MLWVQHLFSVCRARHATRWHNGAGQWHAYCRYAPSAAPIAIPIAMPTPTLPIAAPIPAPIATPQAIARPIVMIVSADAMRIRAMALFYNICTAF